MKRRRLRINFGDLRLIDIHAKRTPEEAARKAALDRAAGDECGAQQAAAVKNAVARLLAEDAADAAAFKRLKARLELKDAAAAHEARAAVNFN